MSQRPDIQPYRLIAYDVETSQEVFDWPNYAGKQLSAGIPSLSVEPEVLHHGSVQWEVCGTRKDSTVQVLRIDVKNVGRVIDPGRYQRRESGS
jgi:hypothetical protein